MFEFVVDIFNVGVKYVIFFLFCGIFFYGLVVKKVKVYEVFVDGVQEGFIIVVRIIFFLVVMLVAIVMFWVFGMLDLLLMVFSLVLSLVNFLLENLLLVLMCFFFGSGFFGLFVDLVE